MRHELAEWLAGYCSTRRHNRPQREGRLPLRALYSRDEAERSLERLRGLARDTDALVVLGHERENWSQLKHAPDFYA